MKLDRVVGTRFSPSVSIQYCNLLPEGLFLLVVLQAEVRDLLFAHHPAQGVLELRLLDEEVVLGVDRGSVLGTLEVEGQPFLDALHAGALGEVEEQREVKHEGARRGSNRGRGSRS